MDISGQHKERTADQAFSQQLPLQKGPLLYQKWKGGNANRLSKVVDFDDSQDTQSNGRQPNLLANQESRSFSETKGRLKQRASELLKTRQQLPIWAHAREIRDKVNSHDVLLLVGETGSGKSTQIPQFLLSLCQQKTINGTKVGGCIAITQPRRVAAISLARRVADEMGTPLGKSSPASQVGYSVRFDNSTSPSTKVKFVTDGMLLQELVRDPWLKEYSVVVVDEVHERGVNVDLVLGFLKQMIDGRNKSDGRKGIPLKVVVMSATADMEKIQAFFGQDNVGILQSEPKGRQNGSGEQRGVKKEHISRNGISSVEQRPPSAKVTAKIASCYIKGRQYPVKMHYTTIPLANVLDAALERITDIHSHAPLPGDILAFLPGQETIDTLESMCISYAQSLFAKSKEKGAPKVPKLLILPLFAALPTVAQQRVFEATPPFTRKIILSTNIAETSVTVPGIRHVIDTGKRKARFFRPGLNLDTLLTKGISRSSANQRAGRAGREAPGHCYRLFTEKTFYEFEADTEPEIIRCDLSQLVLILKSHHVENILKFPLLTPLPQKALERALLHLVRLKALDRRTGQITQLGNQMSTLPVPANLARILLASQLTQYDCLEEVIDIISGLSVENIWLPIHNSINREPTQPQQPNQSATTNLSTRHNDGHDSDDENPITTARSTLYRREGDHLTLLSAIQAYTSEQTDRKDFCRRHALSHRAMQSAMDIRKQLRALLLETKSHKYKPSSSDTTQPQPQKHTPYRPDVPGQLESQGATDINSRILQTLLLGLSDKIAVLSPLPTQANLTKDSIWMGPYTTLGPSRKNLQIHPSSVLFRAGSSSSSSSANTSSNRPAYIMFSEFVVTGRAYARCVSAIEASWLDRMDEIDYEI